MACFWVNGCSFVPLAAIAAKTGLGEVVERVISSLVNRNQMIHCETNILPSLIDMAVFAQKVGAMANLFLDGRRKLTRHGANPEFGIALGCEQDD